MPDGEPPIFIFASGQRCGSTLLQRLLNSHPEVFIWGEHEGRLCDLLALYEGWLEAEGSAAYARRVYREDGYDSFTAHLRPSPETVREASRCFVRTLFSSALGQPDKSRWGFKEVRYGREMAGFLRKLFPECRVVHLTRDVVDCFISLKAWEGARSTWRRANTERSLHLWQAINAGFLSLGYSPQGYYLLKYEDLIADPAGAVERLSAFLEIDPAALNMRVFARRIHGAGPRGDRPRELVTRASLSEDERALLTRPELLEVSRALGYRIAFDD